MIQITMYMKPPGKNKNSNNNSSSKATEISEQQTNMQQNQLQCKAFVVDRQAQRLRGVQLHMSRCFNGTL